MSRTLPTRHSNRQFSKDSLACSAGKDLYRKGREVYRQGRKGALGDWAPCSRCARWMERKESPAILCGWAGRRNPELWTRLYRVLAVPGQFFAVVHGCIGTLRDLQSGFACLPLRHAN
jgi:hypothetical protein